jgi:hypothetical protein
MAKLMNLKDRLHESWPLIHIQSDSQGRRLPNPKNLCRYIVFELIQRMERDGDYAFAWFWKQHDMGVYNKREYDTEIERYTTEFNMKLSKGTTTWYVDYYNDSGKRRRCYMDTEIWYEEDKQHNVSPVAFVFSQYMGNGLHITKCRWEDI